VFATNDLGLKVWEASPALRLRSGRSGEDSPPDCLLFPLTPFGGVHVSTGAINLWAPPVRG
jgi:hypothetical protein